MMRSLITPIVCTLLAANSATAGADAIQTVTVYSKVENREKTYVSFMPQRATAATLAPQAATQIASRATAQNTAQPGGEIVALWKGKIQLLKQDGKITRVAIGNGDIISTTAVGDNLMVIAESIGETSLLVWANNQLKTYRIRVQPKDPSETKEFVDAMIRPYPNLTLSESAGRYVVTGALHKDSREQLIKNLGDLPGVVLNIREDIGSPYVESVLFRVHFLEINRSLLEKTGIKWAQDINGPTIGAMGVAADQGVYAYRKQATPEDNLLAPAPSFLKVGDLSGGVFFGLATTLASRINLLVSEGDARVLASPELTAKSGGKARLQVGGEVPIPMAAALGVQTVEFKPYGIIFTIEPTVDANNIITAKIGTEMSQIDPAVTVNGIPGFLKRETSTEISVKSGEAIALSGLVNSELSESADRVPWISKLPVLGQLFRSNDFRNKRTEFIVLIEPEIIKPGDGLAAQLKARGDAARQEFEERVRLKTQGTPKAIAPQSAREREPN